MHVGWLGVGLLFCSFIFSMKNLFFLLIFISTNCFCQTISGVVLDRETKKPLMGANIYLTGKRKTNDTSNICYYRYDKYKIIANYNTDSLGKFYFEKIKAGLYNIIASIEIRIPDSIYLVGGGYTERSYLDSKVNFDKKPNYYTTIYLDVICEFDKTKDLKFCPICKKKDKVLPIMFGLPIPLYNEKGVEMADENGLFFKDYYHRGCIMDALCNPSKHCTRCKNDF
jgi:hypothetical protein